jgi:hypothetical protein
MQYYKVFSSPLGKIVGEKSTVTANADVAGATAGKSFKFYLKNQGGTETSYQVWYTVAGVGTNPVAGLFKGIQVNIVSGSADTVVAAATRAALIATAGLTLNAVITGATNQIIITGRWPYDTTNIADVDTGYAFATTTAGSATVATAMNLDASAAAGMDWVARPYPSPSTTNQIYARQLQIAIFDSAFTDGTTFGAIAGLTNGISLTLRDINQTALATFFTAIKNNTSLLSLGRQASMMGAIGWLLNFDFVSFYGGEILIDGSLGQDLCLHTADNLTGLDGFYATLYGHYTATTN